MSNHRDRLSTIALWLHKELASHPKDDLWCDGVHRALDHVDALAATLPEYARDVYRARLRRDAPVILYTREELATHEAAAVIGAILLTLEVLQDPTAYDRLLTECKPKAKLF